jgi:hypothetical protein
MVTEWFRLLGAASDSKIIEMATLAAGLLPFAPPGEGDERHLTMASALAAMSPEFQMC